jgi:hypothetical protein
MSLRKPPVLTPASLAARRANALKSTGPRTPEGKQRVMLNALKHGQGTRSAEATHRRLSPADQLSLARLYRALWWAILPGPEHLDRMLPLAYCVWNVMRKMEREARSAAGKLRGRRQGWLPPPWRFRIRLHDERVVISVQLRRARGPAGARSRPVAGWDGEWPVHVVAAIHTTSLYFTRRWSVRLGRTGPALDDQSGNVPPNEPVPDL